MRNPRADPEAAHYRGLAYPYFVNPPNAVAYRSATARVRRQAMLRPTLGDRFVNSVESSCPHCSTVSTPRGPWCAAPRPRGAASSSETAHQCIWRPSTHPQVLDAAAQGVCCHSAYELNTYIRCQTEEYLGHKPPRHVDMWRATYPHICVGLYYVAARPRAVDSAHFCRPLPPHNVQASRNSCYTTHLSSKRAARLSETAASQTMKRKT